MRTTMLQFMAVIILAGCSVKEDRTDCPCTVLVDFTETDPARHPSVNVVALTEGKTELSDTVYAEEYAESHLFRIRRVSSVLDIFSGWTEEAEPAEGFTVEKGKQFPPLYMQTVTLDTDRESVTVKEDMHKAYCNVTINVNYTGNYPYSLIVEGDSIGYTAEGSIVPGVFSYSLFPDTEGLCSVRIPRQYDSSLTLCVLEDEDTLRNFAIGEYIEKSGYDWKAEDLEDIEIEIDYTKTLVYLKVNDWETTFSFDVII